MNPGVHGSLPDTTSVASAVSMSLDGPVTTPGNDREHPLGVDGERLFQWLRLRGCGHR